LTRRSRRTWTGARRASWVTDAYLVWSRQRGGTNADVTFDGYTAALDHEERTATRYASVLERVSDVLERHDAYLEPRPAGVTETSQR
jgi:hypothetical protein